MGAKSGVKISEPCEPAGDSCSAFFYFDENLRSDPQATNGGSSAADGSSETAAPNYYCDPINNNQVCREDNPADCKRCNGSCEVGAYGKLADVCRPFEYICNDTGLIKSEVGASTGYPCTCKAEGSGYFYNDEQARAALCNSTALKEFYCTGNTIKPVTKSGEPEGSWEACLRHTSCLNGNRGYYANLEAAVDAMCAASAVPDGAYYCYADGRTVGNGNNANTCSDGYACVPGEVSNYDTLYNARTDLCKSATIYKCGSDGGYIVNDNNGDRYDCPSGAYCAPGYSYYYFNYQSALDAMCSVGPVSPEPALNTVYFECKESGTKICQVDTAAHGRGETARPDTCSACPTGYKCVNGTGYYGYSNLGDAVNANCTGGAADGVYYCYADGKTVGNGNTANTCSDGYDACIPGERSQYNELRPAQNELCYLHRYQCAPNGEYIAYGNVAYGPPKYCPSGKKCAPYEENWYANSVLAVIGMCTSGGGSGVPDSGASGTTAVFSCQGSSVCKSCSPGSSCETCSRCPSGYDCGEFTRDGNYHDYQEAAEALCTSGRLPAAVRPVRYYCDASGQNVVAPDGSHEACPAGFGCSSGAEDRYSDINAAKNTVTGLCTKDLRTHYYCGVDGSSIYDSSGGYRITGCPANQSCVPGSKTANMGGDAGAAMEALCRASSGSSGSSSSASSVANTAAYDCRNGNTVCLSGSEECNTCSLGKECVMGAGGVYSDLDEAVEGICTGSVNQAKADQTPITNDLPWWV